MRAAALTFRGLREQAGPFAAARLFGTGAIPIPSVDEADLVRLAAYDERQLQPLASLADPGDPGLLVRSTAAVRAGGAPLFEPAFAGALRLMLERRGGGGPRLRGAGLRATGRG